MKSIVILFSIICIAFLSFKTSAQIDPEGKKVKVEKKLKEKKKKAEGKIDEKIDNAIDNLFKEAEETIEGAVEEDTPEEPEENINDQKNSNGYTGSYEEPQNIEFSKELKVWSKYDFVSGDKIIFLDDLENERHGEFPSKWDLVYGNAENAKLGEDNVVAFMNNKTEISPLMKTKEYLPEIFTIEFDIYYHNQGNEAYSLNLKNQNAIDLRQTKVSLGKFIGEPDKSSREEGWHHIAVSFNQRALKVYFDQTRVLNIPNIEKKPTSFTISALSHGAARGIPSMIKDVRVAEGGVELYNKLLTDGRIVTRGIYFDVNKATIKPESMGVINEIAKLLKGHPEINFTIEGHTDTDGDDQSNQTLSENRAKSVKDVLVSLGIDSSRLDTKGFGESKPVNGNSTPEEKANNRRVEFVKI